MVAVVRKLDHFVIVVSDLAASERAYRRLGFAVMPKARHASIGTSNHIAQFHDTYLELLGDIDRCSIPSLRTRMERRLSGGDGLSINCLTSTDLESDRAGLISLGQHCDPIISARRQVAMPDGSLQETASDCFYVWRDEPLEWSSLFYTKHNKPEVIWIPQWQTHPNTTRRVLGMSFVSGDLDREAAYFDRLLGGEAADRSPRRLGYVTPRGEHLELLIPDALDERFAVPVPRSFAFDTVGIALRYGVSDISACRAALDAGGVPFVERDAVITVAAEAACGVISEFVEIR